MASKRSETLSKEHRSLLLKLARESIRSYLEGKPAPNPSIPACLNVKQGAFVTLKIDGNLRGCIGHILPMESLFKSVSDNAVNAAFRDPRFPPLSKEELKQVDIEISVLSVPKTLPFKSPEDLLRKLRPNIDGVILKKGRSVSTFLPQVWDDLPDKIGFLEHLSRKAGLPKDAWKDAEIRVYQAEHFSEIDSSAQ
ncbi:MAG: AmmeMemoRadiSam system protein A [Nanoarchaeota archaeon]